MENNSNDFRMKVIGLGERSVEIMTRFLNGEEGENNKIMHASSMIREAVKVSNRNQLDAQVRRSHAIRLITFIPKEKREEYIALTNPEAKPYLLLGKPK